MADDKVESLVKKLRAANEDIATLQDKVVESQKEAEAAKRLRAEYEQFKSDFGGANAMQELQAEIAKKDEKHKQQLEDLVQQQEADRKALEQAQTELAETKNQQTTDSIKGDQAGKEVTKLRKEKADLSTRVMEMEAQLVGMDSMSAQLKQLQQEAHKNNAAAAKVEELSEEVKKTSIALDEARAETKTLSKQLEKSQNTTSALKSKLDTETARASGLEREKKRAEEHSKALEAEVAKINEMNHTQIAEAAELKVKLISLEANAEAQSHEVKTLQEKHHVSSIQETILKSKALEMERRSEMLEKQLEELLLQPDVQRTDNKDSSEQQAAAEVVGESSVHLQATMIERDDLKKQLHQAQSAIAQMEVDVEYSETVKKLKQKLGQETENNERLKQQVEKLNAEVMDMQKSILTGECTQSPLHGAMAKGSDPDEGQQMTKLSRELEEMKVDRATLIERATTAGQEAASHLRRTAELKRENQSLEAQLMTEKSNSERHFELHKKSNKELEIANSKLIESANERSALKKELSSSQRRSTELENQVEHLSMKLNESEAKIDQLKMMIEAQNKDVKDLQSTLMELSEDFGTQLKQ